MSTPFQTPKTATGREASVSTVVMATDYQLQRLSHHYRLALAAKAEGISRRKWADAIADTIYGFEGTIYFADGRKFEPTDTEVDDTFDDPDFRWISDFLGFADVAPPDRRQGPQRRTIARLRLIDLYFRIKHPERARLIAE